jgi:hypothetical protein
VGAGFARNALVIFDAKTMMVHRKIALPRSWAKNFSRDPHGNVWIGFSGSMQSSDNRVLIYSALGELVKTLRPCRDPEAGISFAAGRAFIACAEDGFSGKVVVVNLDTLDTVKTLVLSVSDNNLLLIASAASEETVVVAGLTSGPKENKENEEDAAHSVITLIDPHTLTVQAQIRLGKNTDIWRILPHAGRFYLLNVGSWRQPREQANDVLVLTPSTPPTVTPLALAPSPVWGVIEGNALYAYHNPTWNQTNNDPHRQISRLDLASGQIQTWELPDEWDASDLAIINGEIILVKWEGSGGAKDGLYRFDPNSGQMSLVLNVADASRVLPPR